jgi:hypothetical protein
MTDTKQTNTEHNDFTRMAAQRRVDRVANRIERTLHGLPPDETGAILAHLLSLWLAGHVVAEELHQSDRPETTTMRNTLLLAHVTAVRAMLPMAEQRVLTQKDDAMRVRALNEAVN